MITDSLTLRLSVLAMVLAGVIFWIVLTNRGLALFAIWVTALLLLRRKHDESELVEISPDGTVRDIWSAWDCYDPVTNPSIDIDHGWTHANAMDYDAAADAFQISLRNLTTIVQVDRATGACDWGVGGSAGTVTIDGPTFFHQHQFQRHPGRLLVFDNDGAPGFTSRVLEYDFDGETATHVRTIEADPPLYSFILGDVHRFDDGDTMVVWSVPSTIDRIDADDERNWRLQAEGDGVILGFSQALLDPGRPDLGVSR